MVDSYSLLRATSKKEDGNLSIRLESLEIISPQREAFLAKYGIRSEDCVYMDTEHGDAIVHVGISDKGTSVTGEAFITNDKGVVLYLLTADCFPVTFYDTQKHVLALAHMGWKPTDKQLASKVIDEMKRVYESSPDDISVFIGPGIHKESYVFKNPAQKELPGWANFSTDLPSGETQIDILGHIQEQVLRSGVLQKNIEINSIDTARSTEYFSHYRTVRVGEVEGRFATIVGIV